MQKVESQELHLVDTGRRVTINGKKCRVLGIERHLEPSGIKPANLIDAKPRKKKSQK